jgi:hypothetical protein
MQSGVGQRRSLASLIGPVIPTQFTCLTFYFQMFGKHVDSLRVAFRLSSHKDVIVWQLEGNHSNGERNHSNEWNKAQIPLNTIGSTKFKVTSISK